MFIEFQIKAESLLPLIRNRMKRQRICVTDRFAIPVFGNQPDYVLDHFKILNTTRLERTPLQDIIVYSAVHLQGSRTQIVQPVDLFIAEIHDLAAANDEPLTSVSASYLEASVEFVFDIMIVSTKDGLELRMEYNTIRPVGLALPVLEELDQLLQERMQALELRTPLNLSSLEELLGNFAVAHADIGSSADASFIAIRIEAQTLNLDGAMPWGQFYNGQMSNNLVVTWTEPAPVTFDKDGKPEKDPDSQPIVHTFTDDWSLFIDHRMIVPIVSTRLQAALEQSTQFDLQSSVNAGWACAGHLPRIIVDFSGYVLNIGAFNQDVGTKVTVKTLLSVLEDNVLKLYMGISWEANGLDEFVVGLTNVFLIGAVGTTLGVVLGGPIGAILGGLAGVVGGMIGVVSAANSASPGGLGNLPAECEQVSDTVVVCRQPIGLPSNELFGNMTLNSVQALCNGPLLFGGLENIIEAGDVTVDTVSVTPLTWGYRDPCGAPLLAVSAEIGLAHSGDVPLELCEITSVGSDPFNQFTPPEAISKVTPFVFPQSSDITIEIVIPADKVKPEYVNQANPYPLSWLIQTNGGTRLITLPGFHALTDEEKATLDAKLLIDQALCVEVSEQFWEVPGGFKPDWGVEPDPASRGGIVAHLWQVAASGLAYNESLSLVDGRGQVVSSSFTSTNGFAQVNALVSPDTAITIRRNTLRRGQALPTTRPGSDRRLMIQQTLLLRAAVLEFDHPITKLVGEWLNGRPMLFCLTSGKRHHLYDLSIPHSPAFVRQVEMPGLLGVRRWEDGFAIWGEHGLQLLPQDARCPARPRRRREVRQPVRDVVEIDGQLHPIMAGNEATGREPRGLHTSQPKRFTGIPWFDGTVSLGRMIARPKGKTVEIWNIGRFARIG